MRIGDRNSRPELNSEMMNAGTAAAVWSRVEDKTFESALVEFPDGVPDRWQKIADCLPGKSPDDIIAHYDKLCRDIADIEAGVIELPSYRDSGSKGKSKQSTCERKKGQKWTEEEHKLFLIGIEIYGHGDWKSIARYVVKTRDASQVASHSQKYYIRLKMDEEAKKKRASIHDITLPKKPNMNYSAINGSQNPNLQMDYNPAHIGPSNAYIPNPTNNDDIFDLAEFSSV